MKKYFLPIITTGFLLATSVVFAQTNVKMGSTGEAGSAHQSDVPAEGDPLGNKPLNEKWNAGAPSTQAPYTENCKEDRCVRAKQRQLGNTTWQEDRSSGLHKSSSY